MKGIKVIAVFSSCGFVLSFVFGLFSHSPIGIIFIKALITTVVFFVLGFLISFIYKKFLDDSLNEEISDSSDNNNSVNSKGQNIDITIQDEELEQSSSDKRFFVNDKHQMLNKSDIKQQSENATTEHNSFVPIRNLENMTNISGTESVTPNEVNNEVQNNIIPNNTTPSKDGLDILPDMEGISFANNDNSLNEEYDTDTGESFSSSITRGSDSAPDVQNAELIAKAISSVLSNENS